MDIHQDGLVTKTRGSAFLGLALALLCAFLLAGCSGKDGGETGTKSLTVMTMAEARDLHRDVDNALVVLDEGLLTTIERLTAESAQPGAFKVVISDYLEAVRPLVYRVEGVIYPPEVAPQWNAYIEELEMRMGWAVHQTQTTGEEIFEDMPIFAGIVAVGQTASQALAEAMTANNLGPAEG